MLHIAIKNISSYKQMYNSRRLKKIAEHILIEEGHSQQNCELSIVFCNDDFIQGLNKEYRHKNNPTDVLSFPVPSNFPSGDTKPIGEIIISLQTVLTRAENPEKAIHEIDVLFCHGLLHLLGYIHDTPHQRRQMIEKQAKYLGIPIEDAWIKYPKHTNKKKC
ncbi:MAG: rRNA maturation RNase YbeY [Candidatus Hydrogenedens sp.]|nr:rRNA maturation RNase YbeY [Candidatus Hydrogenedens sp.]